MKCWRVFCRKVIMAEEGRYYNPSYVDKIQKKFDPCIPFQFITHKEFKMRSQKVKELFGQEIIQLTVMSFWFPQIQVNFTGNITGRYDINRRRGDKCESKDTYSVF